MPRHPTPTITTQPAPPKPSVVAGPEDRGIGRAAVWNVRWWQCNGGSNGHVHAADDGQQAAGNGWGNGHVHAADDGQQWGGCSNGSRWQPHDAADVPAIFEAAGHGTDGRQGVWGWPWVTDPSNRLIKIILQNLSTQEDIAESEILTFLGGF